MFFRPLVALSLGLWLGAGAGLLSALSDFGAHWLFMESGRDRWALMARLLCTQLPAAAALGLLGAAVHLAAARPSFLLAQRLAGQRAQYRRWTQRTLLSAAFSVVLAPATGAVSRLLFSGGRMQQLHAGAALQLLVWLTLTLGVTAVFYVGFTFVRYAKHAARPRAYAAAAALFGAGVAASKLDQHTLPNLYAYLHGGLTAFALCAFAAAIAALAHHALGARLLARGWALSAPALVAALAVAWVGGVRALDDNQNVRVALLAANMPHSRSLMLGIEPLLPREDPRVAEAARQHAARARAARQHGAAATDLPSSPGAHVLLITVDALRADRLGLLGNTRGLTPELDALGSRGIVFEHAYTQAPHSSYSLSSLMTSEYLHETLDLGHPAPTATLPRVLASAGYHTAAFYTQGIFHTAGDKLAVYENDAFGFALHDHQDRPAEQMTDRVLSEVDRVIARGEPSSLLWVHYFDVHEPYEATTLGTSDADRYDSEIIATDRAIGRLVREAQKRLQKEIVVVVTADHGEEFHEHGGVYHGSSLYEEQVRVPLLVHTELLPPARVAAPVESIDITPTVLGLVDVDKASSMRGADLRALALGKQPSRGPVFSAVIHKKMVVSWPYKLVADLRFALFELYDLSRDPRERDNLADRDPARVQALRGEVYAWLDSLTPKINGADDAGAVALEWGRLGDRRAVQPLSKLVLDDSAPTAQRCEGARLLGKLADPDSTKSLLAASRCNDEWVRAEAAIALGRLFDVRAAPMLRELVDSEDPGIRSRAAVSLGRLRDPRAVPALIDALWIAPSGYEREESIRWLGRLRQPVALDPLIDLLPEAHTRHLVVVALGDLGDRRGVEPLLQVLDYERNTNVRNGVVRALGTLGDPQAIDTVMRLASTESALSHAGESLVRLGAVDRERIGGTDITRAVVDAQDFRDCYAGPLRHDWDYLHRTYCATRASTAQLTLPVPEHVSAATEGAVVMLTIRRADAVALADLTVTIAGNELSGVRVDGAWTDLRWTVPSGTLRSPFVQAILRTSDPNARFDVDHLLLVPQVAAEPVAAEGR